MMLARAQGDKQSRAVVAGNSICAMVMVSEHRLSSLGGRPRRMPARV
jgi:hypothetical protein